MILVRRARVCEIVDEDGVGARMKDIVRMMRMVAINSGEKTLTAVFRLDGVSPTFLLINNLREFCTVNGTELVLSHRHRRGEVEQL